MASRIQPHLFKPVPMLRSQPHLRMSSRSRVRAMRQLPPPPLPRLVPSNSPVTSAVSPHRSRWSRFRVPPCPIPPPPAATASSTPRLLRPGFRVPARAAPQRCGHLFRIPALRSRFPWATTRRRSLGVPPQELM
jgi:hypothetical protein